MGHKPMTPAEKRAARQRLEERKQMLESLVRSEEQTIKLTERLVSSAKNLLAQAQSECDKQIARISSAPDRLRELQRQLKSLGKDEKHLDSFPLLDKLRKLEQDIKTYQTATGDAFVDESGTFHCPNGHKHSRGPLDGFNVYRCFGCPTDKSDGPKTYRVLPQHDHRTKR